MEEKHLNLNIVLMTCTVADLGFTKSCLPRGRPMHPLPKNAPMIWTFFAEIHELSGIILEMYICEEFDCTAISLRVTCSQVVNGVIFTYCHVKP